MTPDIADRLEPALRPLIDARTVLTSETIGPARESLVQRRRDEANRLDSTGVEITDGRIHGSRTLPIRVYRGGGQTAPAVVYCHSGAFVLGNLDMDHRQCVELARRAQCTVVSFDYRLAPEHPFPAAMDDATAVLTWVAANAAELDVDARRLAVVGNSAGGALAACLAQRAATGAVPPLTFQMLHQPVLDDRPTHSKAEFGATPGFDGPAAELMWRHYLAGAPATADAVPGRRDDVSKVAKAFITCSELDPLRDEAIDYATRLLRAEWLRRCMSFPGRATASTLSCRTRRSASSCSRCRAGRCNRRFMNDASSRLYRSMRNCHALTVPTLAGKTPTSRLVRQFGAADLGGAAWLAAITQQRADVSGRRAADNRSEIA